MTPKLSGDELREVFRAFLERVTAGGPIYGFSGTGVVEGFTINDPEWRFIIDGRKSPEPGRSFAWYEDSPKAPQVHIECFTDGETLDTAFCGELHVPTAVAAGRVRFKGDVRKAIRLLPAMLLVIPLYREVRMQYVRDGFR
jgi:hypothetical protein